MVFVASAWLAAPAAAAAAAAAAPTEAYPHDAAFLWMEALYDVVKNEATPPPQASRIYGIAAVALYESVVSGSAGNRSLVGQLNELEALPELKPNKKIHWLSSANAAMATVIRGLYPAAKPSSLATIAALEHRLSRPYRAWLPKPVHQRSVEHGRAVAAAILAWSRSDGFSIHDACAYAPPTGPGLWEPTPPAFAPPLQPCWGRIRTMALTSGGECAPPPPPLYSEDPDSELYLQALNTYTVGLNLTPEQIDIAHYWADGPGATGTPPGHSIGIMGDFVLADDLDLMAAAEGYARVGIAVHDAFIACWNAKFVYNLLRPITYIRNRIDPAWSPLLTTPNFPEHVSGHSTQSGATEQVVLDFVGGDRAFLDTTRSRHALLPVMADRALTVVGAAEEAAVSRLYGGIHYATGNDGGLDQGRCIGRAIVARLRFSK
jgi:hypothetical protein